MLSSSPGPVLRVLGIRSSKFVHQRVQAGSAAAECCKHGAHGPTQHSFSPEGPYVGPTVTHGHYLRGYVKHPASKDAPMMQAGLRSLCRVQQSTRPTCPTTLLHAPSYMLSLGKHWHHHILNSACLCRLCSCRVPCSEHGA
jgi:hypothetical protein